MREKIKKSARTFKAPARYTGKWVAFVDDKPVAADETLGKLMKKIKSRHFRKSPSVMLVPRKDEGPYVLLII